MPELSGNKGEWSEIYVFLRLLEMGKLYAADSELNKLDDVFYNIINIIRNENAGILEFRIDHVNELISVVNTETNIDLCNISINEFKENADKLYNEIVSANTPSFSVEEVEAFLDSMNVNSLKAKSTDKADIRIKIHDINTGYESVQGFSIKSRLGGASNFIYEITGPVNDNVMNTFNDCSKVFKNKFTYLKNTAGCDIAYHGMENETFEDNLSLIDGDLPKICAYMLAEYYSSGVNTVQRSLNALIGSNPLNYNLSKGQPF